MEVVVFLLVVAVVFGGFGGWVAGQKNREGSEGFVLGFLFGPLGVLVEALLPAGTPPTPPKPLTQEEYDRIRQEEERRREQQRERARRWDEDWRKRMEAERQAMWELRQARLDRMVAAWAAFRAGIRQGWANIPEWVMPVLCGLLVAVPIVLFMAAIFRG